MRGREWIQCRGSMESSICNAAFRPGKNVLGVERSIPFSSTIEKRKKNRTIFIETRKKRIAKEI